jgi:HlyD family secretion protein
MREIEPDKNDSGEAEASADDEEVGGNVAMASTTEDSLTEADDPVEKVDTEGVFVLRDGKAMFTSVKTGIADQQNIEIVTGLDSSDVVITGSYRTLRTLKDKTEVEAKTEKPTGRDQ